MEPPASAAVGLDYTYLWVDSTWCKKYGVGPEEARGRSLESMVGEQNFRLSYRPLLNRARAGAAVTDYLHRKLANSGHSIIQIHVSPVEGTAPFLLVFEREVTEALSLRQGHRELQEKLSLLVHGESVIHVLLTADGRVSEFSPALGDFLSDAAEIRGGHFVKLLQDLQEDKSVEEFYGSLRRVRLVPRDSFETTLVSRGGQKTEFRVTVTPQRNGETLEFFHVGLVDISERNASLSYQRESEEYLHTLFRILALPALLVLGDEVRVCNPVAQELLGAASVSQVEGVSILEFLPEVPHEGRVETHLRCADGRVLQIELTVSPVLLGGQRHLLCLCYNLSEQKGLQEALRSAALAAESANRGKTAFLSTMSHEIRTPLNGILGLLHLAQHTSSQEKKDEYLQKLQRATQALLAVVEDVSDFTVVEAGNSSLQIDDFDLTSVLEETHCLLLEWTRERPRLIPRLSLQPGLPERLRGDSTKLGRVLSNLCSNAVKFTPEGEIELTVAKLFQDEAGCTLEFQVRDTGVGIPAEQLQRVFAPFTQADSSASRFFGGIGLGLFLSKRFVELLGGTIQAISELGKGSCFLFTARFALPASREAELGQICEPKSSSRLTPLVGKVLVVDDNDINQEVASEMLRQLGLEVDIASNGWQAVEVVRERTFDAILWMSKCLAWMAWRRPVRFAPWATPVRSSL